MMHAREKSDFAIVAEKPTNKAERSAAEPAEPRAETKGKTHQQNTHRTQSRVNVTQALERIRKSITITLGRHSPEVGAVNRHGIRTPFSG